MKKFLIILTIAIIGSAFNVFDLNAQCNYQVKLYDSWGDGWNGSSIDIKANTTTTNYTLANGVDTTINLLVATGDSIVLNFIGGGIYDSEISFEIIDPNFVVLYSSGTSPAIGYHFDTTATCPSCISPGSPTTNVASATSAEFSWTDANSATEWQIEYGTSGFTQGTGISSLVTNDTVILNGLTSNISYDFYVRSVCAPGDTSLWVGPTSLFIGYCQPAPTSVDNDGITNVSIGSINNSTLTEVNNYGNYSNLVTDVNRSTNVSVDITYSTGYTYDTKIWVDWNQDYDFDDLGEEVFSGTSLSANPTTLSASFTIPPTAPLDTLRMRIGGADSGPITSCYTGSYASFEDYSINVLAAPNCIAPTGTAALNIYANSAAYTWTENNSATEWQIEYDTAGFVLGTGNSSIINNDTTTIAGLLGNASFDFYVRSICGAGDTSNWSVPVNILTLCDTISSPYFFDFTGFIDICWSEASGRLNNNTSINYGSSNWTQDGFGNVTTLGAARLNIYSTTADEWLITPSIDLGTGAIQQQLEFDVILTDYSGVGNDIMGPDDSLAVVISTDNGITWDRTNILQLWTAANQPSNSGEHIKISLASYTGLVKIGFYGASSVSNTDYNVYIDNFELSTIVPNNISLVDLIAPSPLCAGPNNVSLVLTNSGNNAVDSVEFAYHINNFSDTSKYPLTINVGDTAIIPLGAFPFIPDSLYNITFYTFNPNSSADGDPSDDTIRFNGIRTGLNGAYSIDSSSITYGTNFNTITEFSNALKSSGMCGTVVANLAPGVHSGQLDIIGNAHPIVINGTDTSLATISHDGGIRNATIFLQDASDITIVNTTIESTGGADSWGIQMYENVNDVVVANNRFVLSVASTSDKAGLIISGSETSNTTKAVNVNNINITSNSFYGGYSGVSIYGGSAQNERLLNIMVTGNNFQMQEYYGIYAYYTDSILIAGNTIGNLQNSSSDGIYLSDIENFNIYMNNSSGRDNGMYMEDANSEYSVSGNALIANNMFIGGDDGLYITEMKFTNIFHNSFYAEDYGIYLTDQDSLDIRNNIFYSNSDYAMYALDSVYSVMDYNIYHTNGTGNLIRFGGTTKVYADLSLFQTAVPSLNMNSLQGDPLFASTTDLHVSGPLANDVGDNSVGITSDIDGDTRPLAPSTTVDIGADEFALANCLPVSSLDAFSITGSSANLSWFENGTAMEWEIEYDTTGFAQGTGSSAIVGNDTTNIAALSATTAYEFYVRAICGPGDTSAWSGPFAFTTGCMAYLAPYIENFTAPSLPLCWAQSSVTGGPWVFGGTTNPDFGNTYAMPDHTNGNPHEYTWVDFSSTDNAVVLETPEIDISALIAPALDFWLVSHNNTASVNVFNIIFVEAWDGTAYQVVDSIQGDFGLQWQNFTYDLTSYVYNTNFVKLRFRAESGGDADDFDNDILLDDVSIMELPSCIRPTNLAALPLTINSVELSWLENNSAGQWEIEYDSMGFVLGTGINSVINNDSIVLNGLVEGWYEFYVRSICAPGDTSAWISVTFRIGYCDITFPSNVEPITLVDFAGISNVTSALVNGTPDLEDFTAISGTVNPGNSYPIALEGNTDGNFTNQFKVYFDWNQDGDFDELDEAYYIGSIVASTGTDNIQATSTIVVPTTALVGNTLMRVTKKFGSATTSAADPCNSAGFGQAEDYTIQVVIPIPTPHYTISELSSLDSNGVADSLNVYAWTSGTVAGVDLDGSAGLSFTIIDQSAASPAGINVSSASSVNAYAVNEGDSINVRATVVQLNGLLSLDVDSIVLIQSNASLPAYSMVSQLDESTESQLVQLQAMNVISVGTGTDYEVLLSNGTDTVSMWVDGDTDVDNIAFGIGQSICTVFGIGSQDDPTSPYLQGYRIVPMSSVDVVFTPSVNLGLDTIVCDTNNFVLDAGAGFSTYTWNTGEFTQSIVPTDLNDSLYIVTVTNAYGCSAMDSIIVEVDICTGIMDYSSDYGFELYPNPSNGSFSISAQGLQNGAGNLTIKDISGKVVYNKVLEISSGSLDIYIELEAVAKGIYFMNFNNGNQNIIKKVVIQ